MKKIYQIAVANFTNGKKTNKVGVITLIIGCIGGFLADKYNLTYITENPELYYLLVVGVVGTLFAGGKK